MRNAVVHYVATHKKIDWEIPFPHRLITLDGYRQQDALDSAAFLPEEISSNRTFAFYRAGWVALENSKNLHEDNFICLEGYRCYFGTQLSPDVHRTVIENPHELACSDDGLRTFMTPAALQASWESSILKEVPSGIELIISRPVAFPFSILQQYATCHHIDDLLFGLALGVRYGLLSDKTLPIILNSPYFINTFVGRVSFYRTIYGSLYKIACELSSKFGVKRDGYQERAINFVLERLVSIYLTEKVFFDGLPTMTANLNQITEDGIYRRGE